MRADLKQKLTALGLSVVLAAGTVCSYHFPDATAVSAKSVQKTYKVNKYGVLTKYSGDRKVHIRANVSALAPEAFDNIKITEFTVSSNNKYFKAVDGVLYTKGGKKLVRYPSAKKGAFVVPDTVTCISQNAFRGCNGLTSIEIPDTVNEIGNSAFYGCKKLKTINLPSKLKSLRKNTFYQCRSLETIALPKNLEKLGAYTFSGCHSLTSINLPASLKKIGEQAFYQCKALKHISIPNKIKSIPPRAFESCVSLETLKLGNNVERIKYSAFSNCTSLKTLQIPDSVDYIDSNCFESCTSLKRVRMANGISSISYNAFRNCKSLESIYLPNSIKYIGSEAFKNCSSLKSVSLPSKSFKTINYGLFQNCTSLKTIKIPKSVTDIAASSFTNAIASYKVEDGNKKYSSKNGILYNAKQTHLIKYPCYKSGSYTTPDTVKSISDYAFKYCHNLKNVTIREGITRLNKACFYGSSVETISLPSTLMLLENASNRVQAAHLKKITIPKENKYFSSENGILYTKEKDTLFFYPAGMSGTITFPAKIADLSAIETENQASAFSIAATGSSVYATDDGMLTNAAKTKICAVPAAKTTYTMGKKIKNIDALFNARKYTHQLKSISVNKANTKFSAKDGVLMNANMTKILLYPNAKSGSYKTPFFVTKIPDSAFMYAEKLTSLTIGKNVSSCTLSLYQTPKLTSLTLKEGSLRRMNLNLDETSNLKQINLPTSLVSYQIKCPKSKGEKLTIAGWSNTVAERLAKHCHAKFSSVGVVPKRVKNIKVKAYISLKSVKLSWKRDPEATGYEIYSNEKENLKTIKDNRITEASIYVGDRFSSVLYIRAYKVQKNKKIYGKATKIKYQPYSR